MELEKDKYITCQICKVKRNISLAKECPINHDSEKLHKDKEKLITNNQ